jgi:hypothetical protein
MNVYVDQEESCGGDGCLEAPCTVVDLSEKGGGGVLYRQIRCYDIFVFLTLLYLEVQVWMVSWVIHSSCL